MKSLGSRGVAVSSGGVATKMQKSIWGRDPKKFGNRCSNLLVLVSYERETQIFCEFFGFQERRLF